MLGENRAGKTALHQSDSSPRRDWLLRQFFWKRTYGCGTRQINLAVKLLGWNAVKKVNYYSRWNNLFYKELFPTWFLLEFVWKIAVGREWACKGVLSISAYIQDSNCFLFDILQKKILKIRFFWKFAILHNFPNTTNLVYKSVTHKLPTDGVHLDVWAPNDWSMWKKKDFDNILSAVCLNGEFLVIFDQHYQNEDIDLHIHAIIRFHVNHDPYWICEFIFKICRLLNMPVECYSILSLQFFWFSIIFT